MLVAKAKRIKAVVLDGDGVLFDGRILVGKLYNPERGEIEIGEIAKSRSYYDGQGISLLRDAGLLISFVSSEKTGFLESVVDKFNRLPSVKSGRWPKIEIFTGRTAREKVNIINKWLEKNKIKWSEICYMGDDLSDLQILKKVQKENGLTAAPRQAEKIVKDLTEFISERPGGFGAIRDLVNFILEAKGVDQKRLNIR